MATEQDWHTQQDLANELENLTASQQTGTLFCVSKQGHSATITLQQGDIVGLGFKTTFGAAALPLLAEIGHCRLNFRPNIILRTDADLPGKTHILALLLGMALSTTPAPAAVPTVTPPKQAESKLDIDLARLKRVTAVEANKLLGPVGALLSEEYFAKVTQFTDYGEIRTLLTALVSETGATERTGQLIDRVFRHSGIDQREQRD